MQHDLDVVHIARTNRVAVAAQRARPDGFHDRRRREPGLQRLVAAARRQHVKSGFFVRRAAEDAQPAADAIAEIQIAHATSRASNTTFGLRMNEGSSATFIARWRSTISLPNIRRIYGFITPPKR